MIESPVAIVCAHIGGFRKSKNKGRVDVREREIRGPGDGITKPVYSDPF